MMVGGVVVRVEAGGERGARQGGDGRGREWPVGKE